METSSSEPVVDSITREFTMKFKKLFVLLITILFVTIGTTIARSFYTRYRDISETIRQGEAYGFTIGEDKEKVFWRLSEMAAKKIFWNYFGSSTG